METTAEPDATEPDAAEPDGCGDAGVAGIELRGAPVDAQSRCVHYRSSADVVAIMFACCRQWYPCILCHREFAGHTVTRWPHDQRGEPAVWCGACRRRLRIEEYLQAGRADGSPRCPRCAASFNPGCRSHHHLYFAP